MTTQVGVTAVATVTVSAVTVTAAACAAAAAAAVITSPSLLSMVFEAFKGGSLVGLLGLLGLPLGLLLCTSFLATLALFHPILLLPPVVFVHTTVHMLQLAHQRDGGDHCNI